MFMQKLYWRVWKLHHSGFRHVSTGATGKKLDHYTLTPKPLNCEIQGCWDDINFIFLSFVSSGWGEWWPPCVFFSFQVFSLFNLNHENPEKSKKSVMKSTQLFLSLITCGEWSDPPPRVYEPLQFSGFQVFRKTLALQIFCISAPLPEVNVWGRQNLDLFYTDYPVKISATEIETGSSRNFSCCNYPCPHRHKPDSHTTPWKQFHFNHPIHLYWPPSIWGEPPWQNWPL